MISAPLPSNETQRLAALRMYGVLDTAPEPALDDLTTLAASICEAPIALITLVDEHRQWFKSRVGLQVSETPREFSFCAHALGQKDLFVIPDAALDERFAQNPQVTGEPGIRFYAGAPLITPEGAILGTLCVIDRIPRTLTSAGGQALRVLSRQVMIQLELHRRTTGLIASESRYRSLFEYAPDGILIADINGTYLDANVSICRMLGYARAEFIGRHAADIVVAEEIPYIESALSAIKSRTDYHREWRFRRKDGSTFPAAVIATQMPDGNVLAVIRDITEMKAREGEIARLSRLYAALSQVDQAIVWTRTRDELFGKICRVLVEQGGFDMAWIGWCDAENHRLVPMAEYGDENAYLQSTVIHTDDRPEGRGPAGTAFRTGRPYVCNDMCTDPATLPWRAEVERRCWRASAAFPIRVYDEVCGTLTVYALDTGFFRDKEIALIEEAASDISFALDNLASEEARRQAEAIAQGEKLFSDTMIESMPGILYFYDDQGRFLRWNRTFETVSGYSREEIARMHPLDFFASADQPLLRERIAEVFAKGESSVEAPFLSKNGRATPYFFTGRRVIFKGKACLVGVGIDISVRKEAEERLAESERKYRELVEHANSIILRWNSEGRITLLNEFGQRFFGYSAEEILGRHVLGTIVPATESSGRDLDHLIEQICADPEAFEQNVNENIRRNGQTAWISWTNRVERDEEGRVREILSIGTDITERLQAEQAVRELNASLEQRVARRTEELQAALVRAEAADRLKSAFLATMSHELRTPLNSIIGFTGTVLKGLAGPLNAEQTKQLGMVRSSARHLLELINDVLDLSKIEAGQLKVRAEPFDLRASLEHATGTVKVLADKKGLALTAVVAPEVSGIVSDRRRVEQIVLNLLNNAIKFTDGGRVTLHARLVADFRPSPEAPPQPAVRISVADTGIGIQAEHLSALFQPFQQVDTGLARQHEGTGLGLVICRRLAALLGGAISVASEWTEGSEFSLTLPLRKPPDI